MATLSKTEILQLDVSARLELIEELWESISSNSEASAQVPLTDETRSLLDERLREHRANPGSRTWAEIRADILKSR